MRYDPRKNRLELSTDLNRNLFRIIGEEFQLETLEEAEIRKGGNSDVFRAQHPDGNEAYVVKFCRYLRENGLERVQRRIQRFEREIEALSRAQRGPALHCTIPIVDHGIYPVRVDGERRSLRYYVMEEADSHLGTFLRENDLTLQQKLFLCSELLRILKSLHSLEIYHRDIKPENILMLGGAPVFGDLGLVNFRQQDTDLDEFDEKVGPVGYLSPEATNKHLGIRERPTFAFDCWIDDKSDIFQLGQIFWLILQDEVPTGHLSLQDLRIPLNEMLTTVLHPMLQYGKNRRASIDAVEAALAPILRHAAVQ